MANSHGLWLERLYVIKFTGEIDFTWDRDSWVVFKVAFDLLQVKLKFLFGQLKVLLLFLNIRFFFMNDFLQSAHGMQKFTN